MTVIDSFQNPDGTHTPLSNFSRHPITVLSDVWPTTEHYYQAQKTLDLKQRDYVRGLSSPGAAKQAGRVVDLRPDWEEVKLRVMREALLYKFTTASEPGLYLLRTGHAMLIEGNKWGDIFWGQVHGFGANWLGHLLMARRAELFHHLEEAA